MINFYDPKRSISKLQLALCAGVCPRAFAYYLESRREILYLCIVKRYRLCRLNIYEMYDKHIGNV